MKTKATIFSMLTSMCIIHAENPKEFTDFPKGSEPGFIGQKIAMRYLSGFDINTKTGPIGYPETCTWFGALRFADATEDDGMLHQLEENFLPLLSTHTNLMQTPNHVDRTVFGVVPLQLYMQTGNVTYRSVGIDFADKQWTAPANPSIAQLALLDRGLSWQTRFWVDDMYMITSIQSRAYLASGDEKYIDRAAHEMVAYLDSIQRPNGLFHHEKSAPFFWGRGNGWMAAGMTDLLSHLPDKNPNKSRILQEYRKMMATLKSYQNDEGLWNQLIDEPDAWTETSGSAMFAYAMITGVKKDWLDAGEYAPVARRAWLGLLTYLSADGAVRNVCEGTNIGTTKEYYMNRARNTGDLHGQAALLWCAVALYDTNDNSSVALTSLAYDSGTLSPAFHPGITEYTCDLPAGTGSVTPRLTTSYGAKVTGGGAVNIGAGTKKADITVTSIDGTAGKTYTVNFTTGGNEDLTGLIVNNDFEMAFDANCNPVPVVAGMNAWSNNAWRPKDSPCRRFYGWDCNLSLTGGSNSLGINADGNGKHGSWVCWFGGDRTAYTEFEFSQTIDKNSLSAGTYRVQCLLAAGAGDMKNNQRMFANNRVQYYGNPSDYDANLVAGEQYAFAGHLLFSVSNVEEMMLYVTINDDDSLKIGVRTSNMLKNGTVVKQQSPMFKTDYFRLTKLDPDNAADAGLADIALSTGTLNFSPQTTVYNVTLPAGTKSVTAVPVTNIQDAAVAGAGAVDVSSGAGVSAITVTALDGITAKNYTVNYTVESGSYINKVRATAAYSVANRTLTVNGVESYTVYGINGTKIADVKKASVDLLPGIYIVKTAGGDVFKALVNP
jgi:rhamnogalacturonyl hydrolase YesR